MNTVNYYYLLFHAVIRLARRVNPAVTDQGLSDGGYWSMNAVAALYLLVGLHLLGFPSKTALLASWLPFFVLNYWLFARHERWKSIVAEYDAKPAAKLELHTILLVSLLVFAWLALVVVWATHRVTH